MNWKRLWLPLLAIVVTVGALWFTNRAVTPTEPTRIDVVAEASEGGHRIMNTNQLRPLYEANSRSILLVNDRHDWEFAMGHTKGAVNLPHEPTSWSGWPKKGKLAAVLGPDKNRSMDYY